jgi:hypothetical protein
MSEPNPLLVTIYRKMLLLYPARLRREYQDQMLQTLRDANGEAGSRKFWPAMFYDLMRSALGERILMATEQALERPILVHAFCLGVILTMLGGAAAITFQQMLRRGADQPQHQMAEFYAFEIGSGEKPEDAIPPGYVDLERSLEPFVIYYDESGTPGKATGYLDQSIPIPPRGVFDYARSHGTDTFTWQSRPQVRIATVLRHITGARGGYILAGRSLRDVEKNESILYRMTFLGWLAMVLLLASGAALLVRAERAKARHWRAE